MNNTNSLTSEIEALWDDSIIPTLIDYIRIPNKSPLFDAAWQANGFMDQAVKLLSQWFERQNLAHSQLKVIQLENKTPVILIEVEGATDDTVLLYGHLDKQPEMTGWHEGLGPWTPVLKNNKLYGRGGADDGYALFAAVAAIKALQTQHIPHARCLILIEACEESGSRDLPFYIEVLKDRIRTPDLIICLDSGCGNYEQLWTTTSLRGLVGGILSIQVLKEGIHSGVGSGVVPSPFLLLRQLLNRIENETNSHILLQALFVKIPEERILEAKKTAQVLKNKINQAYPFLTDVLPLTTDPIEQILNQTWRPALSVVGMTGLPHPDNAGNVTVPSLSVKLSMRLPPTCQAETALTLLKNTLEKEPPYQAKIQFEPKECATGWNAQKQKAWLTEAIQKASQHYFGADAMYMGEGGSIPFMGMLGKRFPAAQFFITGLLGPESNAHGPNEFLHIPAAKKLTGCIAEVIAKHLEICHSLKTQKL